MTKRKKRIMRSLKIEEISGVDRPAQEGARAVIMKRDESVEKGLGLTSANKGHTHLVGFTYDMMEGGGHTSWALSEGAAAEHRHPYVINGTDITIGRAEGHTHSVTTLKWDETFTTGSQSNVQVITLEPVVKSAGESGGGLESNQGEPQMTDKKAAEDVTKAELDETKAKLRKAEALAEMSDAHKSYFKGLDEDAQEEFLEKSEGQRQSEIENAQKADKVVYTDAAGNEYRKSDDQRLVSAIKRADEAAARAEQRERVAKAAGLTKRASEDLKHFPGKVEEKVELLKAIEAVEDEAVRDSLVKMLKAGDTSLKQAFATRGTQAGVEFGKSDAETRLDALAKSIQEKDPNLSYESAYVKATETAEGAQLYSETLRNLS